MKEPLLAPSLMRALRACQSSIDGSLCHEQSDLGRLFANRLHSSSGCSWLVADGGSAGPLLDRIGLALGDAAAQSSTTRRGSHRGSLLLLLSALKGASHASPETPPGKTGRGSKDSDRETRDGGRVEGGV